MIFIIRLFYNYIFIPVFFGVLYSASIFNDKVRRALKERKEEKKNFPRKFLNLDANKKRIWFHSSSLGEFEQAKPIIEKLRSQSNVNIIVTFFSPSGYENSINYSYADSVSYIPFDTESRCKKFLDALKPDVVVFMRYDIWPNMIIQLNERSIPSLLVDATMRVTSPRKLSVSKLFHTFLFDKIDRILTVSKVDLESFMDFDLAKEKLKVVGDTRFDRVYQKSLAAKDKQLFKEDMFKDKIVFVAGSSWPSDEEVLLPALLKIMTKTEDVILIVAPHEPTVEHLDKLEQQINPSFDTIRFSYMNNYMGERVILIDSIGILLSLYFYADIAFVGGGFKQSIHNVLEPAVYGIPVLFGPKIQNSQEAFSLIEEGSARILHNKKESYRIIKKLVDNYEHRKELGIISAEYVKRNIGATSKIVSEIQNYL